MARKSIRIHYRSLGNRSEILGETMLQKAISQTFQSGVGDKAVCQNWQNRIWRIEPDHRTSRVINLFEINEKFAFGDLTLFEHGAMQAIIESGNTGSMVNVHQMPAGEGTDFIQSLMYWMVINDHVLVIQSQSLLTKHLEEYLTWFLRERGDMLANQSHVILDVAVEIGDAANDIEDIRNIVVGGTSLSPAMLRPRDVQAEPLDAEIGEREVERFSDVSTKRPWRERALDVLRATFGDAAEADRLVDSLPEGAELDVAVRIGYRLRKKELSRAPMSRALRNLPDGEFTAEGKYGKLKDGDLRLSYDARIETKESLLDPNDARRALMEAYQSFVNNGRIHP